MESIRNPPGEEEGGSRRERINGSACMESRRKPLERRRRTLAGEGTTHPQ
jgi:hypothetical protein